MGKRGGGDDEDALLWARVTDSASPLKRRSKAAHSAKVPPAQPKLPRPVAKTKAAGEPLILKPAPPPKPRFIPSTGPLDRQTSRHLEKGRIEVEAKLDLHGMRQRDAHAALKRFLKTAQARGAKHVLVITGKGSDPEARRSFYDEEERGVLRNAVPRWLSEPDFAPLVVSYAPAPRRLGGDGALYVRVRRVRSG